MFLVAVVLLLLRKDVAEFVLFGETTFQSYVDMKLSIKLGCSQMHKPVLMRCFLFFRKPWTLGGTLTYGHPFRSHFLPDPNFETSGDPPDVVSLQLRCRFRAAGDSKVLGDGLQARDGRLLSVSNAWL